jgi:hypothetical protein
VLRSKRRRSNHFVGCDSLSGSQTQPPKEGDDDPRIVSLRGHYFLDRSLINSSPAYTGYSDEIKILGILNSKRFATLVGSPDEAEGS